MSWKPDEGSLVAVGQLARHARLHVVIRVLALERHSTATEASGAFMAEGAFNRNVLDRLGN